MRQLTKFAMALALLGAVAVAGCGQSACGAHPSGLACEQEQSKHKTEEEANRSKEEQNTPQAKTERKEKEERESEPSEKYSGKEVTKWFTEEESPRASEKASCPEGSYEEYSHLVCTLSEPGSETKYFAVTVEHGKKVNYEEKPEDKPATSEASG
jgi:hypothetical protein